MSDRAELLRAAALAAYKRKVNAMASPSDWERGYHEGAAKVAAEVEAVLREHGLINTREALGDLRVTLGRFKGVGA